MIRCILIPYPYGSDQPEADRIAELVAKKIEIRSSKLQCPNGHLQKDHPDAAITIRAFDNEGANVSQVGVCCPAYYNLLISE